MRQGFILASANKEERFVAVKGPFCVSCNQRAHHASLPGMVSVMLMKA